MESKVAIDSLRVIQAAMRAILALALLLLASPAMAADESDAREGRDWQCGSALWGEAEDDPSPDESGPVLPIPDELLPKADELSQEWRRARLLRRPFIIHGVVPEVVPGMLVPEVVPGMWGPYIAPGSLSSIRGGPAKGNR
jgi:hypothetical protein